MGSNRQPSPTIEKSLATIILFLALLLLAGCGKELSVSGNAVLFQAPEGTPLDRNPILENDRLKLTVDSNTGKFTLVDKQVGHEWRSNAPDEELAGIKSAGDFGGHVASPFIVEYRDLRSTSATFKRGNFISEKSEVKLYARENAVEVAFDLKQANVQFSFVLHLDGSRLVVDIPGDRILENKDTSILRSIQPYPYFGAVLGKSKEGYILLPSGPGFAMEFYDNNYPYSTGYQESMYGKDSAVNLKGNRPYMPVNYPVFGIKQDRNAFLAIVEAGEVNSKIVAGPSGLNTPYNWAGVEFNYVPDDFIASPYSAEGKQRVNDYLRGPDRRTIYTFLTGADADYVGMGKAYRDYLMKSTGAKKLPADEGRTDPFNISVYHGSSERGMFGRKTAAVTTFSQAKSMLEELHAADVDSMQLSLVGWNEGGEYPGLLPKRLPPDKSYGSIGDLRNLTDYAGSIGVSVQLFDNVFEATSKENGFNPREDAVRSIKGFVIESKGNPLDPNSYHYYLVNPKVSADYLREALPSYREWGIDGVALYSLYAEGLSSDYNHNNVFPRERTKQAHNDMLDMAKQELGKASFGSAYAYLLGHADFLHNFPIRGGFDLFNGETVPFYPIAVHGLVGYSGSLVNGYINEKLDRLKHIEYGAIPAYELTWGATSDLKYSNARWHILSSRFDNWKEPIVKEYNQYREQIGSSMGLLMEGHEKLAPGIYRTTYEGGLQVIVNYTDRPYQLGSAQVPAFDYIGLRSRTISALQKGGS